MYLTIAQCDRLAEICSRFEVALRSCVADIILLSFTEQDFINHLKNVAVSFRSTKPCIPINGQKYSSKAASLAKKQTYYCINNAKNSFDNGEVIAGDVLSVGDLVDVILLFYNPHFLSLGVKFDSLDQFVDMLSVYHNNVRNRLFHTASAKINEIDAEKTISLISRILMNIEDKYCWFSSKQEINILINVFISLVKQEIPVKNNLRMIAKKHNQLLLRENEMKDLMNLICGNSPLQRVAGSIELHGYGGVGKTALTLEFCYEVIRREMNRNGNGYNFILWLSSKTEELSYHKATGIIHIRNIDPIYSNTDEITEQLKLILGFDHLTNNIDLMNYITKHKLKGLIILDNIESFEENEKQRIKNLIREFPRSIQFILTSRNYENIAEENYEIKGFSDVSVGKRFIYAYCKSQGLEGQLDDVKVETFIKNSFGNTLILVLGLSRVLEGTSSLETIIAELQVHDGSDIGIIVDFMYKNTFDIAIKEIEIQNYAVNVKELLTIMLIYDERIDFHSLRELLAVINLKELEAVLTKLITRFVINKIEGYYELHEFAKKFIILKFMPDALKLKEMQSKICNYKNELKEALRILYEDRQNYSYLEPIFEDWKPATEAEVIAIAQAYKEFKRVKEEISRTKEKKTLGECLILTKSNFSKFELRSFHPYVKFQKARVLKLFRRTELFETAEMKIEFDDEIIKAYEEAYFTINFRNKPIASTESYAAFLWLYGLYLQDIGRIYEAARILEECIMRFENLRMIRNKINPAKANTLLAEVYARLYLDTKKEEYLNKVKGSCTEAKRLFVQAGSAKEQSNQLALLQLFTDVFLQIYNPKELSKRFRMIGTVPYYLYDIKISVNQKINSFFN